MLAKWNGKLITVSCLLKKTLWGLPHIVKVTSEAWSILLKNFVKIATYSESRPWSMAKSTCQSEFHPYAVFSIWASWEMDVMPNVNFALSSQNKDQLKDLYNYLNQKVITAINTLGRYCTFVPPFCYWWFIMKKRGWKLYRSPNPNLRGVGKCNSAHFR